MTTPTIAHLVQGKDPDPDKNRWARQITIDVPDVPNRLLVLNLAGRDNPDVIVPGTGDHGVAGAPVLNSAELTDEPMPFLIRGAERLPGKSRRNIILYALRNPAPGPINIYWELGTIDGWYRHTSGALGAAAYVVRDAGPIRDMIAHEHDNVDSIELPIAAEPNDLVISALSSGKLEGPTESHPREELFWRDHMGAAVKTMGAGSKAVGATSMRWDATPGDPLQAMGLAIIAIAPADESAEEPPTEEPPTEEPPTEEPPAEHPALEPIQRARQSLLDAMDALEDAESNLS